VIWRIRERTAVARVACDGRRIRAGVLWCSHLPDPAATPPRVAFAIGRAVGGSVVRNRVRRRVRELLRLQSTAMPPGWYLVGASAAAADRSFDELRSDVDTLIRRLQT
jgi:ribonuclease P protein component